MMFGTAPAAEEIAFLPADEATFFGASLAHIAAYYEKQRLDRIERQCRMAVRDIMRRGAHRAYTGDC